MNEKERLAAAAWGALAEGRPDKAARLAHESNAVVVPHTECDACDGTGTFRFYEGDSSGMRPVGVPCKKCGGTGKRWK